MLGAPAHPVATVLYGACGAFAGEERPLIGAVWGGSWWEVDSRAGPIWACVAMVSRFALSGSRVDCARLAAVGRGGEAALGLAFVHRVRLLSVGPPARPLVWLVVWVGSVASPCVPALALGALGLLCRVCLASRWAALGFRPCVAIRLDYNSWPIGESPPALHG